MLKRIMRTVLFSVIFLLLVTTTAFAAEDAGTGSVLYGRITNNASKQNYRVQAGVMESYLTENADGSVSRVECVGLTVTIETYSKDGYVLTGRKTIPWELSSFGGFFSGKDHNYLVFGAVNGDSSESAEVLRVVKYDKSWNRLGACSVYGANTSIPFFFGSLRMAESGGRLYLHTSHMMYGGIQYGHQANMTLVVDEASLTVADSYYSIGSINSGYVSHSLNQFIQTDGTDVFRVDHGDGYPRAVVITKSSVSGSITNVRYKEALPIPDTDAANDNATGVSVGGFELSADKLLIAGNSVDTSSSAAYSVDGQRNIFLAVTDKSLSDTNVIYLTNYTKSSGVSPSTPQLVKCGSDQFLLLWEETDAKGGVAVKAVTVDGNGNKTSSVVTKNMRLSDCQPIYAGDGLVKWYVSDGARILLYEIDPGNPARAVAPKSTPTSGVCGDDLLWKIENGQLTISGSGPMWEYGLDSIPWRNKITGAVLNEGVTSISDYAFCNSDGLLNVTVPKSVTSYGMWVFASNDDLTEVTFLGDMKEIESTMFSRDSNLSKVTVRGSVDRVDDRGFSNLTGLTDVTFAHGPTVLGEYAFMGCKNLANLNTPDGLIKLEYQALYNCPSLKSVTLADGITEIGDSMFYNCQSLKTISIPKSVRSIGFGVFVFCTGLEEITLPGSVTGIEDWTFYGCQNLKSITIPNGVTSVGSQAFYHCTSLTGITIPAAVTSFGTRVFEGCSALERVTFGGSVDLSAELFQGCTSLSSVTVQGTVNSIESKAFYQAGNLTELNIGHGPTRVGDQAFYECGKLTTLKAPDGLSAVGAQAFYDCSSLTGVTFANGLTGIGERGFYKCAGLTGVVFPDTLTGIGTHAFDYCAGLGRVTIPKSVTRLNSSAFGYCGVLDVYFEDQTEVPAGYPCPFYKTSAMLHYPDTAKCAAYVQDAAPSHGDSACYYGCTITWMLGEKLVHPEAFVIRFDAGLGNSSRASSVAGGDGRLTELPTAYRTGGYVFGGWYTQQTGGTRITADTVFTRSMTLYAHWSSETFEITFDANGGSVIRPSAMAGTDGRLAELPDAYRNGYVFDGWYTEKTGGTRVTASTVYTRDTTIYAHWTEAAALSFTDVSDTDWYYGVVLNAARAGFIKGVGDNRFDPESDLQRAQFTALMVRVLLGGEPDSIPGAPNWYDMYYTYANKIGLLNGIPTNVDVEEAVPRYEMAQMIYNAAKFKGLDVSASKDFYDSSAGSYSSSYDTAIRYAYANGLITGKDGGDFAGADTLERAQAAAVAWRFHTLDA